MPTHHTCRLFLRPQVGKGFSLSTSYQDIIDAIDAAILAWASEPLKLSFGNEGMVEYRSLDQLNRTRDKYAGLLRKSQSKRPFQLLPVRPGGSR